MSLSPDKSDGNDWKYFEYMICGNLKITIVF